MERLTLAELVEANVSRKSVNTGTIIVQRLIDCSTKTIVALEQRMCSGMPAIWLVLQK